MARSRVLTWLRLLAAFALLGLASLSAAPAREMRAAPADFIASANVAELPPEARDTLWRIHHGGPFPFPNKDGSVFGNFERRLPMQVSGYYREYTVPTPGRKDRGAQRIIAGSGLSGNVANSGEYYYTGDHYRSFRRIRE